MQKLKGTYDIILLSNVGEYFGSINNPLTLEEYRTFINEYYGLLNDDGLLINYLYRRGDRLFLNSNITISDIKDNVIGITDNMGYLRVRK